MSKNDQTEKTAEAGVTGMSSSQFQNQRMYQSNKDYQDGDTNEVL